jgi:cadmium resistance protein CadD (predicted permease)
MFEILNVIKLIVKIIVFIFILLSLYFIGCEIYDFIGESIESYEKEYFQSVSLSLILIKKYEDFYDFFNLYVNEGTGIGRFWKNDADI